MRAYFLALAWLGAHAEGFEVFGVPANYTRGLFGGQAEAEEAAAAGARLLAASGAVGNGDNGASPDKAATARRRLDKPCHYDNIKKATVVVHRSRAPTPSRGFNGLFKCGLRAWRPLLRRPVCLGCLINLSPGLDQSHTRDSASLLIVS